MNNPPADSTRVSRATLVSRATRVSQVKEQSALSGAACMFRSLGDPARLAILRHLALGERMVKDLTDDLGLAQSTVSAHLACLRDCGLVTFRPQGRATLWSLTASPEILQVLTAAEQLMKATGNAVALCPTYGEEAARS